MPCPAQRLCIDSQVTAHLGRKQEYASQPHHHQPYAEQEATHQQRPAEHAVGSPLTPHPLHSPVDIGSGQQTSLVTHELPFSLHLPSVTFMLFRCPSRQAALRQAKQKVFISMLYVRQAQVHVTKRCMTAQCAGLLFVQAQNMAMAPHKACRALGCNSLQRVSLRSPKLANHKTPIISRPDTPRTLSILTNHGIQHHKLAIASTVYAKHQQVTCEASLKPT